MKHALTVGRMAIGTLLIITAIVLLLGSAIVKSAKWVGSAVLALMFIWLLLHAFVFMGGASWSFLHAGICR